MKRHSMVSVAMTALVAVALFSTAACKSSGIAVTSRGQILKLDIQHPTDLPDSGEDNLDITLANRGVNNVTNIFADVEVPSQLIVLDQTNERGITVSHDPGSNIYHFQIGNLQPAETTKLRFHVRTVFGTYKESGAVKVTAWQQDLPGDKLVETAVIKLRS